MYLQDQIQMLIKRVHELGDEKEKNNDAIRRLEFINDQIQETMDELETCIEKLQDLEEENQENLNIFDGKE